MGRRKSKNKAGRGKKGDISASAVIYRGPITPRASKKEVSTHTLCLHQSIALTTTGAGLLNNSIGSSPAGVPQWSSLVNVYDEYRTLGLKVKFVPYDRYMTQLASPSLPVYRVVDHDNAAVLTTIASVTEYESVEMDGSTDPWTKSAEMSDVGEAGFVNTAAPVSMYYIKLFGSGFAASFGVGQLLITYLVQFRGVGV